jgi:hypothetical protein
MHLAIGGGKEGSLFLVNRDNLGKDNATDQVVQKFNLGHPIFATAAFWQNNLYLAGIGPMEQFTFSPTTGMFSAAAASVSGYSEARGGRDTAGDAVKFTVPTVANGKVYIGTRGNDDTQGHGTVFGEIDVYGLLPN